MGWIAPISWAGWPPFHGLDSPHFMGWIAQLLHLIAGVPASEDMDVNSGEAYRRVREAELYELLQEMEFHHEDPNP